MEPHPHPATLALVLTLAALGGTEVAMAQARTLFITDDHIASTDMTLTWHGFATYPANTLIRPERPWERQAIYCYGTCMLDHGGYRWLD